MKRNYSRIFAISLICLFMVNFAPAQSNSICYNYTEYSTSRGKYRFPDRENNIELKHQGDIRVSDDDTRIESISPGGYFHFSKNTFGNKRTIHIDSDSNGKLSYEFFENKKEIPYEPEGRQWLSEVLIEVIRVAGIDANRRAKRIYKKEGIDGVILEIKKIVSNNTQSLYFNSLLEIPTLKNYEIATIAEQILLNISSSSECAFLYKRHYKTFLTDELTAEAFLRSSTKISSNTERGSILRKINAEIDLENSTISDAYFNFINTLQSNTEKGSVMRDLLNKQQLGENATVEFLRSVKRFSSSTELSSVLRKMKNVNLKSPQVVEAYFAAAGSLSSNTELSAVLRNLSRTQTLDDDALVAYIYCAKLLSSNTELGSVMRNLNGINFNNSRITQAYFATVNSMSSNTEKGRVLRELLREEKLSTNALQEFFYATKRLSSNTELGLVLRESIPCIGSDRTVQNSFFLAVNSISSSTEKGRVLRDLLESEELSETMYKEILSSAGSLSSASELSSVLRVFARKMPKENNTLKDLLIREAKRLRSSDYDEIENIIKS